MLAGLTLTACLLTRAIAEQESQSTHPIHKSTLIALEQAEQRSHRNSLSLQEQFEVQLLCQASLRPPQVCHIFSRLFALSAGIYRAAAASQFISGRHALSGLNDMSQLLGHELQLSTTLNASSYVRANACITASCIIAHIEKL